MIRLLPLSLVIAVSSTAEVASIALGQSDAGEWAGIFFNSLALAAIFVPVLIWQTRKIALLESELRHVREMLALQLQSPTFGVEEKIQELPRPEVSYVPLPTGS